MSDRPSPVNGKRSQAWGTLRSCPACGQCLCFGCHPAGPCLDDPAPGEPLDPGRVADGFRAAPGGAFDGAWVLGAPAAAGGVAGLRMRAALPEDQRMR